MIRLALVAFLVTASAARADSREDEFNAWCRSQGGTPTGTGWSLRCNPPSGGSSAAESEARVEAFRQERQRLYELSLQSAAREGREERAKALRSANERGLDAAKNKDWDAAVEAFAGANLLDPSDPVVAQNLSEARQQQAVERIRREDAEREKAAAQVRKQRHLALARGPVVPQFQGTPEEIAARMSGRSPPASFAPFGFFDQAFDILKDEAGEELGLTTPQLEFIRVQENTILLTDRVTGWIMAAAQGTLSPADPITMKGISTVVFNKGAAPAQFADDMVQASSAGIAVTNAVDAGLKALVSKTVSLRGGEKR